MLSFVPNVTLFAGSLKQKFSTILATKCQRRKLRYIRSSSWQIDCKVAFGNFYTLKKFAILLSASSLRSFLTKHVLKMYIFLRKLEVVSTPCCRQYFYSFHNFFMSVCGFYKYQWLYFYTINMRTIYSLFKYYIWVYSNKNHTGGPFAKHEYMGSTYVFNAAYSIIVGGLICYKSH